MSDTIKKQIALGVEDFKEIIDKDGYFVDKTLMIKELIESNAKVTLFTRPRRFGKTLNQFMIRRFFEDESTEKGEKVDNGYLFDGLAVTWEKTSGMTAGPRKSTVGFSTSDALRTNSPVRCGQWPRHPDFHLCHRLPPPLPRLL